MLMKLYAVYDKKSSCVEYFLSSCDEDALRIWFVMCRSSVPMFEFLDDYQLIFVRDCPDVITPDVEKIVKDGVDFKRLITEREEIRKNAKVEV